MRRITVGITAWLACIVAVVLARQDGVPPTATFRAGIDVIELDVSALDKDRHPVHGLTEGDFTVTIDGQPRKVVAFKAVDLPAPPPSTSAPWVHDVAPDVGTNTHPSSRVVAVVIDDGSFSQVDEAGGHSSTAGSALQVADLYTIQKTRTVAKTAINALGPDDLGAIVFTENNHASQDFTSDRARLLTAIDKASLMPSASSKLQIASSGRPQAANVVCDALGRSCHTDNSGGTEKMLNDPLGILRGSCQCGLCSIEALEHVAESLRSLPQQRKVLLYISVGRPVDLPGGATVAAGSGYDEMAKQCNIAQRVAMERVFREAELSNVTIEAVDPKGLTVGEVGTDPGDSSMSVSTRRTEFLRTMAEDTGGRALVNQNDMEREVPALLAESASYYLIGVERPLMKDDGRMHPIRVKVNRPGVEARTRNSYYAPTAKEKEALAASPTHTLDASIGDALPKADFPLDVAVAPFATTKGKADLAIVLNVTEPTTSTSASQEPVDLVVRQFDPESGKARGTWRQHVNLVWNATQATSGQYEVLARMPVDPGRYELRLGVQTGDSRTASVYTYADVPKFSDEPLSLSGLVLSANPSPKSGPKDAFANLLPVMPTARRTFQPTDRVHALLRVYEGGSHALAPATITTHVVDTNNKPVGDGLQQIDPANFGASRSFDYDFAVPTQLPTGDYLLNMDIASGKTKAERSLRFRVQP